PLPPGSLPLVDGDHGRGRADDQEHDQHSGRGPADAEQSPMLTNVLADQGVLLLSTYRSGKVGDRRPEVRVTGRELLLRTGPAQGDEPGFLGEGAPQGLR